MVLERLPAAARPARRAAATRSRAPSTSTSARASSPPRTRRRRPGRSRDVPPLEIYCHSLADPSIVGPGLRERGVQTLTLFALPHAGAAVRRATTTRRRTWRVQPDARVARTRCSPSRSRTACCARPTASRASRRARRSELERELALPGGNIFHRDLQWPFAEDDARGRALGRRDRPRERLALRRGRPPRRRRQRDPRPQRGAGRARGGRGEKPPLRRTGSSPRGRPPTPLLRPPGRAPRRRRRRRLVRHRRRGAARARRPAHDAADAHRGAGRAAARRPREPRVPARTSGCPPTCGSSPRAPGSRSSTSSSSACPRAAWTR